MVLLDTDVVFELRQPERAHPNVRHWSASLPSSHCYLSIVTITELLAAAMQRRRDDRARGERLLQWIDGELNAQFRDRILPIDEAIARRAVELRFQHHQSMHHSYLAATAAIHRMTVATMSAAGYEGLEVQCLDPRRCVPAGQAPMASPSLS